MKTQKQKNPFDTPVQSDVRGEIRRYDLHGVQFSLLYTKASALRSGDYHSRTQYDLLLRGSVEVWYQKGGKTEKKVYNINELIVIPPNIPHLFKSVTDSVLLEWWDGPFDVQYYAPFRKLVEEQFKKK
jgi:mannose-6-phosphate isomerase-like protein (cupin superfamily)